MMRQYSHTCFACSGPFTYKATTAFLIASIFILFVVMGCNRTGEPEALQKQKGISVAVIPWPGSAAVYIAKEKGFFKEEGLNVHLRSYVSGHLGLAALLSKKVDFATVGDTPIAYAILRGEPVTVIASLCETNGGVVVVARKDKGIVSPVDLKGKKIGVVMGTAADFFLHILLTTSYVASKDVTIVNLETERMVDVLMKGGVDAISTWFPYSIEAMERLGDNGAILEDPTIYKPTWNLTTTIAFAENHSGRVKEVLRAVVRANEFIAQHPDEAYAIASKHFDTGGLRSEKEWKGYTFAAALDQGLLLNLEDQVRWIVTMQQSGGSRMPVNIMDHIYTSGLKAVDPAAMEIIGREE